VSLGFTRLAAQCLGVAEFSNLQQPLDHSWPLLQRTFGRAVIATVVAELVTLLPRGGKLGDRRTSLVPPLISPLCSTH